VEIARSKMVPETSDPDGEEPDGGVPDVQDDPEGGVSDVQVVMVGSFNPGIFTPEWMRLHGFDEVFGEAIEANANHNPPVVSVLDLGLAASIYVAPNRFLFSCPMDLADKMLLLTTGIFKTLEHTPVDWVGVQRVHRESFKGREGAEEAFNKMVPSDPWDRLLPQGEPARCAIWREVEVDPHLTRGVSFGLELEERCIEVVITTEDPGLDEMSVKASEATARIVELWQWARPLDDGVLEEVRSLNE
jgi:hypothetical protein